MLFLLAARGSAAFTQSQGICTKKSRQELSAPPGTVKDLDGCYSFPYAKRNPCSVLEESGYVLSFAFYTPKRYGRPRR